MDYSPCGLKEADTTEHSTRLTLKDRTLFCRITNFDCLSTIKYFVFEKSLNCEPNLNCMGFICLAYKCRLCLCVCLYVCERGG